MPRPHRPTKDRLLRQLRGALPLLAVAVVLSLGAVQGEGTVRDVLLVYLGVVVIATLWWLHLPWFETGSKAHAHVAVEVRRAR